MIEACAGAVVIVDAMNVIGSRPDGWWRDRAGAQRRLHRRLADLVAVAAQGRDTGDAVAVVMVLEGEPLEGLAEGCHEGVDVRWARRRGRDAADDRIVEEVARLVPGCQVTVVTADRLLRERVRALGARTVGASGLERAVTGP